MIRYIVGERERQECTVFYTGMLDESLNIVAQGKGCPLVIWCELWSVFSRVFGGVGGDVTIIDKEGTTLDGQPVGNRPGNPPREVPFYGL